MLNESQTSLKRNPVLSIYMSSSNAILLLLSSWFASVAGASLACGHPPITLLQKKQRRGRRWRPDVGGRRRRRRGSRKRRSRRSRRGRRRRRRGGEGEQYKFGGVGFVERILRFRGEKAKKRGEKNEL